jgi:trimeric autotransporter adhesin
MKKTLLFSLFLFNTFYTFSQKKETVPDKYEVYKKMLEKQPYHKLLTGTAEEQPKLEDWQKRVEFERLKTLDPVTGEIPDSAMEKARESVEKSLQKTKSERKAAGIPNVKWKELGPTNVGGRTRGIMYDPNDATRSKVWSGGVSGGLWYNDNIRDVNSGWNKVDDFWENMSISCLAFDPSNPKIFFVGTGEIAGGVVQEVGYMWKSEDAGKSWKKLPNKPPGAFYMYRIVVNKSGEVFVATGAGVQKSSDGGITWRTVLNASAGGTTDIEMASDQIMYVANNSGKIYRSNDSSGNQWTEITPPINTVGSRTELGLALSTQGDKQIIYAYNNLNWFQKSINAGKTWENVTTPKTADGIHFVSNQGLYDLIITVHPTNPDIVYSNGTKISKTIDGGKTWDVHEYSFIHPDHHNVVFNDKNNHEAIFSNDGGIYYSADAGKNVITRSKIEERNKNYNTTQFYSLAIRNIQNDETIIGGTQDNGTWKIGNSIPDAAKALGNGGDGGYCFIDEDDPDLMIGSYQYGDFYKTDRNNLNYQTLTSGSEGSFINPADYDSKTNTLFANSNSQTKIRRLNLSDNFNTKDFLELSINIGAAPSAFKTTQNNTLFLGTFSGKIFKVTGVNNAIGNTQEISSGQLPAAYVRNIDIGANENELLITYSNYSVSSVWYTNDGGKNWINKDADSYGLPNIPVKWAVFNPNNRKQVLLATDLGIWSTNDITANNPAWEISNSGLASVRCDMIKCRASDGFVVVGTHGRGLFSSYIFAPESNSTTKKISTSIPAEQKKLCAGNKLTVSFTTTGSFADNEEFKVFLSDATGNFIDERLIGQGNKSPIVCLIPSPTQTDNIPEVPDLTSGANYKYRIEAVKSLFSSTPSENISIASPQSKILSTAYFICQGSSTTLKSKVESNTFTYEWSKNGNKISNESSSKLLVNQSGNYSLKITESNCSVTSSTQDVIVRQKGDSPSLDLPQIYAPRTTACEGYTLNINSNLEKPDYTIQWQKNGVNIPNASKKDLTVESSGLYRLIYKQGDCQSVSESINIDISKSITSEIQSYLGTDQPICRGIQQIFYVNNYIPESKFQWQLNGVDIPNATKTDYSTYTEGSYTLRISLGKCVSTSAPIKFVYTNEIKTGITSEYNITKMCKGGSVRLLSTFQPGYYSPTTFTWKRNGVQVGVSNFYSFDATQSGDYTVSIQQGTCTANSSNAVKVQIDTTNNLNVRILSSGAKEVCLGANTILFLPNREIYPSDVQYSWQKNGQNIDDTPYSYYNPYESGGYTLTVQKNGCKGISEPFVFKVGNTISEPILKQFSNESTLPIAKEINNCDGQLTFITPRFNLESPFRIWFDGTYQWQKDGKDIPNATNVNYGIKEAGNYSVVLKYENCKVSSQSIKVNYTSVPKEIIPNTTQSICNNSASPTILSATSSDKDLLYQWKRNGFILEGEVSNTLKVNKEGTYQFVVNRGLCSSVSDEIKVVVDPTLLPKATITTDNDPTKLCIGQSIKLSVNKESGLTYQWLKDGKKINLAVSDTLRVLEDGKYSVITDNGKCQATSDVKNISFIKLPNQISPSALEQSFCEKSFLTLSAIANTDTSVKYQWKRNNENISLSNGNSLKITQEGNYQFVATKSGCISISPAINVKQTLLPKSEITTTNDLTTLCVGDIVVLTGNKEDGITYQWKKDSINIDKTNVQNLAVNISGKYSLVTSRNDCPTTSNAVNILFNDKPTALISGGTTLYLSESSTLKIDLTSLAPWTIKISDGKEYTANSTPYSVNVTPLDTNAYTITSVVNRCGTGVSKGLVKFKILAPLANEPTLLNEPVLMASSPNPFNETCTIKYGLPKPSNVKLILYDNQGREKGILVDEKKVAGWHTQNLTSKSLTVGSYILRLEVNGQVFSQKIMLVAE